MSSLDRKTLVSGSLKDGLVVGIALAGHIVIAIHQSAFNMNLYFGPFTERLGFPLCVSRIDNVKESIITTFYHIQSFFQHLTLLGARNQIISCTPGYIKCSIRRHIRIHKHIQRFVCLGIDSCRIAHIRATRTTQLIIPIESITIGTIAVNTEILFVGNPILVFQFQGYTDHITGHPAFLHRGRELLIGHTLVFVFQLRTGSILKPSIIKLVDYITRILIFLRIKSIQCTRDGTILFPVRSLVFIQHTLIDTDGRPCRKDISIQGWGCLRLNIGIPDIR